MSGMSEALTFLALPFVASVVFVLIHAYLGVHVLRRKIVFADLAIAQCESDDGCPGGDVTSGDWKAT